MEVLSARQAAHRSARRRALKGPGLRPVRRIGSAVAGADGPTSGDPRAGGCVAAVHQALELLRPTGPVSAGGGSIGDVPVLTGADAAGFAGAVEELSRRVEYLQILAAAAVDRTRTSPPAASGPLIPAADEAAVEGRAAGDGAGGKTGVVGSEYRNTAEYLRARLRISAADARRRLALAADLLPRPTLTGTPAVPVFGTLAATVADGTVAARAATIITMTLHRIRPLCSPETLEQVEHALTATAADTDPDFLTRVARRWSEAIDQDGT